MRYAFLFIISYLAGQGTATSIHPNVILDRRYTNDLIIRSLIIRTIKKSSSSKKKEKSNQTSEKAPTRDSSSSSLGSSKDKTPSRASSSGSLSLSSPSSKDKTPSRVSSSGSLSLSPLSLQPKDKIKRNPEADLSEPTISSSRRQGYQVSGYMSSPREAKSGQAEGSVVATGPGVIRAQEGDSPSAETQIKPGVIGRYQSSDPKHILTGGQVGYDRPPTPGRQRGQLAAYGKGDIVKVKMDLSKGGSGMIEDYGDSKIPYKDKTHRTERFPAGTGTVERIFSASSEGGPGASVKAQAEEPATIDVAAAMKPPGMDQKKWSGGDLPG